MSASMPSYHTNAGPVAALLNATIYVRDRLHYRVGPGPAFGVKLAARHAPLRWVKDPSADYVSPLGAAILFEQPDVDDEFMAAQLAIGCASPVSIKGLIDGMARQAPRSSDLLRGEIAIYAYALNCGTRLRFQELTTACQAHKIRHLTVVGCPQCNKQGGDA